MNARACDNARRVAAGWAFPGDAASVASARREVRAALAGHVPPPVLADVVLAVSELASNAVRHTASGSKPDGRYAVAVAVLDGPDGLRVRVAVVDQGSDSVPRIAAAEALTDPEALGGRGLGCLACVGSVGWEDVPPGRRVWADLPVGGAR